MVTGPASRQPAVLLYGRRIGALTQTDAGRRLSVTCSGL